MLLNIVHDHADEFLNGLEDAASNALVRNLTKPSFHKVEPRTARRREMDMEAGMSFEPGTNLGVFVRGVIVDNKMEVEFGGGFRIDLLEECDPLLMPMTLHTRTNETTPASSSAANKVVVPLRL